MQTDIDELIHVNLEDEIVDVLLMVDSGYAEFVTYENGKKVLYVELQKALYGTLQASLLFWKELSHFLVNTLGFEFNPYDSCVVNKVIDGKQCTIIWHVDDLMLTHVSQECWNNEFIYLIVAPCRCRGLGVRLPSTIIFYGFPTWYRLVVRIDTLTLRGGVRVPVKQNIIWNALCDEVRSRVFREPGTVLPW
jgi:hypothetical protein